MSNKSWAVSEILDIRDLQDGQQEVFVLWRPTWELLSQMDSGEELSKFLADKKALEASHVAVADKGLLYFFYAALIEQT